MLHNNAPHPLGALVKTDVGEGFIVGRSISGNPCYSVRVMDGTTRHTMMSLDHPQLREVTLIDSRPVDHPQLPKGLRDLLFKD